MSQEDVVSRWLRKVHRADEEFAQAIWEEFFQKLVRLARERLGALPRRDEDEEDTALSAIHSFFRGAEAGRFPKVNDRQDLWRLLVTITVRKVTARRRRFFAKKRGAGVVRDESAFDDDSSGIEQVLGDEPTPELAFEMIDTCDELLARLEDAQLKTVALYKMQSYSNEEIALLISCSLRTVQRRLDRIRALWSEFKTPGSRSTHDSG